MKNERFSAKTKIFKISWIFFHSQIQVELNKKVI